MDSGKTRWLILIYQLPREPSRHRVSVWRRLKTLGALYLQDGATVLPENAVTREQFEWLQLKIREVGGEATLWESQPNTIAENEALIEAFRASCEEVFGKIIEASERLRRRAALGSDGASLLEELGRIEREFRAVRRRDYFRARSRDEAASILRETRLALRDDEGEAGDAGGVVG